MEPIFLTINDGRLDMPGDTISVKGHINQDSYQVGAHTLQLPEGIDYDLVVTNAGEGILVSGIIKCDAIAACDRCLEDAKLEIAGECDEYYLFEEPEVTDDEDEDDIDYELVIDGEKIDLSSAISSALVMETPFVILCQPECKGLCPDCGANLNEHECDCAHKREEAQKADSPFAKLKDIDL